MIRVKEDHDNYLRLIDALKNILQNNCKILSLLDQISSSSPPEGKTHLDLLIEHLERMDK